MDRPPKKTDSKEELSPRPTRSAEEQRSGRERPVLPVRHHSCSRLAARYLEEEALSEEGGSSRQNLWDTPSTSSVVQEPPPEETGFIGDGPEGEPAGPPPPVVTRKTPNPKLKTRYSRLMSCRAAALNPPSPRDRSPLRPEGAELDCVHCEAFNVMQYNQEFLLTKCSAVSTVVRTVSQTVIRLERKFDSFYDELRRQIESQQRLAEVAEEDDEDLEEQEETASKKRRENEQNE